MPASTIRDLLNRTPLKTQIGPGDILFNKHEKFNFISEYIDTKSLYRINFDYINEYCKEITIDFHFEVENELANIRVCVVRYKKKAFMVTLYKYIEETSIYGDYYRINRLVFDQTTFRRAGKYLITHLPYREQELSKHEIFGLDDDISPSMSHYGFKGE